MLFQLLRELTVRLVKLEVSMLGFLRDACRLWWSNTRMLVGSGPHPPSILLVRSFPVLHQGTVMVMRALAHPSVGYTAQTKA